MTDRMALEVSPAMEDLISRNLIHCFCCHQDLDRVDDFKLYSDEDLAADRRASAQSQEPVNTYCDPCNTEQCSDDIQWQVYEPARDSVVECPECHGETVVFGSDGW